MAPNTPQVGSQAAAPTTNPQQVLIAMQERIVALEQAVHDAEVNRATETPKKKVKTGKPTKFDGTRDKLRQWLAQMDIYIDSQEHQITNEADKVILAASFLEGKAADWFEPFLRILYHRNESGVPTDTDLADKIFKKYSNFTQQITLVFGQIEEKREAERKLRRLRQTKSASLYATEFLQVTSRLDWDDEAYIAIFYEGLKDGVKDEIVKIEWPKELTDMIEAAVKIDNRMWERKMEKQGNNSKFPAKKGKGKYSDPYGLQPMDIDSRRTSNEPNKQGKKTGKCYYCNKPGHFARECRKKQAEQKNGKLGEQARVTKEAKTPEEQARVTREEKATPMIKQTGTVKEYAKEFKEYVTESEKKWQKHTTKESDEQARVTTAETWKNPCTGKQEDKCNDWHCRNHFSTLNPARDAAYASEDKGYRPPVREGDESDIRHPKHDSMHWTACYEDECLTHLYGKQGGYYPNPPTSYRRLKERYERRWREEQTKKTEIADFEVVEAQALVTRTVSLLSNSIVNEEKPEQLQQRQLKIEPEDLKKPSEGFGARPRSPNLTIKTPSKEADGPQTVPWWTRPRRAVKRPDTPIATESSTEEGDDISTEEDDTWYEAVLSPHAKATAESCEKEHWLICDNDGCEKHLTDKQLEKYFPRKPCAYDSDIDDEVMSREPIKEWKDSIEDQRVRQADESYRGHKNIAWQQCTNDSCSYHFYQKKNSKWFPQEPGETVDEGRYHWHLDMKQTSKPRICYKTRCAQARIGRLGAASYQQMVKAVRNGFDKDAKGFRVYKEFMRLGMMGALTELQKQSKN
jgi:hypothetical protein